MVAFAAVRAFAVPLLAVLTSVGACTVSTNDDRPPPASEADPGVPPTGTPPAASSDASAPAKDAPPSGPCDVAVTAPPASLGLDPFYAKWIDADGLPVIGSTKPADAALRQACRIVRQMLSFRPELRTKMIEKKARISVMARTELTTDIPEHADLYTAFPGTDWDKRARGLGGTVDRPATSCAEENLLCDATDPYKGENILVHELSHGIYHLGLVFVDTTFEKRLQSAFDTAIAAGKWKDTYAATNIDEYFAEGVQDYFDTNIESVPTNGIHNQVNTRAELLAYDASLHALVAEVFGPAVWTPTCP